MKNRRNKLFWHEILLLYLINGWELKKESFWEEAIEGWSLVKGKKEHKWVGDWKTIPDEPDEVTMKELIDEINSDLPLFFWFPLRMLIKVVDDG